MTGTGDLQPFSNLSPNGSFGATRPFPLPAGTGNF
jgi:hypothetical protein